MCRKVTVIVTAFLILILNIFPTLGKEKVSIVENNVINNDKEFIMDFEIEDMQYYPFVYSTANQWEIDNVIGTSECEDGYLYSKELSTNIIRKLVNVRVEKIAETNEEIFFLYENAIYSVDYLGQRVREIYNSNKILDKKVLMYNDGLLYFSEDNRLCYIDLRTNDVVKSSVIGEIDSLYVDTANNLVCNTGNELLSYSLDINTFETYNVDTELNNEEYSVTRSVVPSESQIDTNLTAIFAQYPSGSYFTADKGPCYHHGTGNCSYWGGCNCKDYCGTIQCVALAKYASDAYAHKSSWNANSGDINETDIQFTTTSQVVAFFQSIKTGAYIRLSYYSESQQPQNSGFHSMFFVSYRNYKITTYECNTNGNCNVVINVRTPSEFLTKYENVWGIYRVSHNFTSNCTSYDQQYHKVYCSRGCGGYIYEAHYSRNNMGTSTCERCGYTGTIEYTDRLEFGNY